MGHIELAAPCTHIWFFKGIPSRLGLILDMSPRALEKVIYFVSYLVIDPGETPLSEKQLLSESEYREAYSKYGDSFEAGMGAEAIKKLLAKIDVEKEVENLKKLRESTGQRKKRAIKRLEVMNGLLKAMILNRNGWSWRSYLLFHRSPSHGPAGRRPLCYFRFK